MDDALSSRGLQYRSSKVNLGMAVVFGFLASLAVCLRVIARRASAVSIGLDDYVAIVVLILCLGLCIMGVWASVNGGLGVPQKAQTQDIAVTFSKVTWALELISIPAIGLIKVSVCLFYKRIFAVRTFKLYADLLIMAAFSWSITFTCMLAFNLVQFPLEWSLAPNRLHNPSFAATFIAMAATDLALNITILSLPIPMIEGLHMPRRKKIMTGGIFGLCAFCVVVASIVRLAYIVKFSSVYGTDNAFSYDENQIVIWSNIEPCASVIAACLPTYGAFFHTESPSGRFCGSLWHYASKLSMRSLFRSQNRIDHNMGSDELVQEPRDVRQSMQDSGELIEVMLELEPIRVKDFASIERKL